MKNQKIVNIVSITFIILSIIGMGISKETNPLLFLSIGAFVTSIMVGLFNNTKI